MAHRPQIEDVCDVCGGRLVSRGDDTPEALATRLQEYYEKTEPVIAIFERKEFVVRVDATESKQQVFEDICGRLGLPLQDAIDGN
jgi:adenylate kinase